ncbi:MAG TPA: Gfo/Idh/MocA family oxidoreductase [Bryobacteraceae bacterium]|nr:Gfo/Idh/MocA family oxidoreductase [Bryobacteraceae bacterium]
MSEPGKGRRGFLRDGAAAAAGLLILKPETVFGSQANSAVEVGLVGCGSRGNWVTDFFIEFTGSRVVALADAFPTPLTEAGAKYKVESARSYVGLNAYQELANSKLDAVIIETPPYFHPEHAEAAVHAGKHVFMAKPVAVDVLGCKSVAASAQKANGKMSFLVDFQTRAQPVFQEAAARVHRGEIGAPKFGHVYYHAGHTPVQDVSGMSPEQATLRNWLHDRRLSGDIIVEQNVHVLDAGNWFLQSHPLKAGGLCGRKAPIAGNVSDNFVVTYHYPNDATVDFSSVQFANGYSDLCIRVYGKDGTLDSHYGGLVRITGKNPWNGAEKDPTFRDGAITNIKNFIESIRTGKLLNNGEMAVESTLTAILGRMAAYSGREVSWDEMMRVNERFDGQNIA